MELSGQILSALTLTATAERRAHSLDYAPTALRVLGNTMPDLNAVTAATLPEWKCLPASERWATVHALLGTDTFEAHLVAWDLVARHRPTWSSITPAIARSLMSGLDNWITVDTLGPRVLGPAWRIGRLDDAFVASLQSDENPYHRRLALTMTVALNLKSRGGQGDAPRTLAVAVRAIGDSHDHVVKALSWALRQLVAWDAPAVGEFIEANATSLAPRVIREVRTKLATGKKNG